MREIHTNLFTTKALQILESVIGQLSDGYWENSPVMEKYWKNASIDKNDEGEVVILVNEDTHHYKRIQGNYNYKIGAYDYKLKWIYNPFSKMSDDKIKCFFADKIKKIVKLEEKDNGLKNWWMGNPEMKLEYFHGENTVKDCKDVYKVLKNHF